MCASPLIVGEVLFDCFLDGRRVIGGAPFNVAWNLQGLGLSPAALTAIGDDEDGQLVRLRMDQWGLATNLVQTSPDLPTGRAVVELVDGEPEFRLLDQQAYDGIRFPESGLQAGGYSMLYVGSLASRHEASRATVRRLMNESGLPKFVDINIRQPWFDRDTAAALLRDAQWTKLSAGELEYLTGESCSAAGSIPLAVNRLREMHGGGCFFVTRGADGAVGVDHDGRVESVQSPAPSTMVDPVGAGDAFSAAAIYEITRGSPLKTILQSAVSFASLACSIQGATTNAREHYARWSPK